MQQQYPNAEIITDVASGLNYRRKGLATILERIHQGDKLTLVVAYRDRLARFGTELIEQMLQQNGGELLVLNQRDLSPPEELTQDLLAILTVFSARATDSAGTARKSRKIRICPDRQQKAKLKLWFDAARFTYNRTIELLTADGAPKPPGSESKRRSSPVSPTGRNPPPTRSRATQSGTPAWPSAPSRSSTSS